ncbi:MAG: RusA family crossover junction endodeoxyribonuclease [Planctomycetota bacterium]|nr:MAG: RusA family crossover junction endodeoxyribonuclease [Planctomycetota bacterium]
MLSLLAGRVQQPLLGPLQAELHLYPPDRRRRDCDNFQKGVWDSLQHAGVYLDDSQIRRLIIEKHDPTGPPRAEVTLLELSPRPQAQKDTPCTPMTSSTTLKTSGTSTTRSSSRSRVPMA